MVLSLNSRLCTWAVIVVVATTVFISISGCSLDSSSSSGRRAEVTAKVAVTPSANITADSLQALGEDPCEGVPVLPADDGSRVSFTPTSMRIQLLGMYLAEEGVYDADAGGLVGAPAAREFDVFKHSAAEEIELVGQTAFDALHTQTALVPEDDFGQYENIKVLYGESMTGGAVDEANVYVSGAVCDGVTLLEFEDLKLPMGSTGAALNMPSKVEVSDSAPVVVQVLFDITDYPYFIRIENEGENGLPKVPGSGDIYVVGGDPPFLPYAAAGDPTVEHYQIRLSDNDAFGDEDTWYLKLLAFRDDSGALAGVQWYPVFEEDFDNHGAEGVFEPGMLYMPEITPFGDRYEIKHAQEMEDMVGPERRLEFPEFKLEAHSGTLNYAGEDYGYEAEKF